MLISVIKESTKNYYVNLEDKGDRKIISIIKASNEETRSLHKDEALNLLKKILSTKLTYKCKEDGYDVYVDETDNKRYFKNGREDYILFFKNNGISAIEYNKLNSNSKMTNAQKMYRFGQTIVIAEVGALIGLLAAMNCAPLKLAYQVVEFKDCDMITEEEMEDYIYDSTKLDKDIQEQLINSDLFNDVLYYANQNRNYELRSRLKHINIETFSVDVEEHDGYYNPTDFDTLNIKEGHMHDGVLEHEFIHMLQDSNEYHYIREASAELLKHEYYGYSTDVYLEEIRIVKILMEIVGPEAIMECNFSGDTTSFENTIGQYLDEEDKKKLLELFKFTGTQMSEDPKEEVRVNTEIESLLFKMYYNKTGEDISDNEYMSYLAGLSCDDRIYFNQHNPNYYNDNILETYDNTLGNISYNDAINSSKFVNYEYYNYYYVPREDPMIYSLKDNQTLFGADSFIKHEVNWNPEREAYEYEGKTYTDLADLEDAGLIEHYVGIKEGITVNSLDEIDKSILANSYEITKGMPLPLTVNFNDDTKAEFFIKPVDEKMDNFYIESEGKIKKYVVVTAPSMAKKFPEQMMNINPKTSSVERNREELITMLDGNGEEIRISYTI